MRKKRFVITLVIVAAFLILWFSNALPKQAVKIVAGNYIPKYVAILQVPDGKLYLHK